MNNSEIVRRLNALEAALPVIPSYDQFVAQWKEMDGLSRSLYEFALSAPDYAGESGRRWETIAGHLRDMGVTPPPFDFSGLIENLESDP